jgi:tubulin gamma
LISEYKAAESKNYLDWGNDDNMRIEEQQWKYIN